MSLPLALVSFSECVSFPGSDSSARLLGVVLGLWTH